MSKYRILTIDGGGLKGLISVRMMQQLSNDPQTADWLDKADLIVGTSTGGIIALGMGAGLSMEDMANLYLKKGKKIFDDSFLDDLLDLGKTIGADYSNKNLRRELRRIFEDKTMGQLKPRVAITAFDLDNRDSDPAKRKWKPKIFHNYPGPGNDRAQKVVDVALYTSAAPTYFPSVDGFIDGGVFANNPSMVGYAQAISSKVPRAHRANEDEVVLLSVGTGLNLKYIKGRKHDWGFAQWVKPLIQILMDGVTGIADYQCQQILDDRYHRLQVTFGSGEKIEMDDVDDIDRMDQIGSQHDVSGTVNWLRNYWMPD